MCEHRSTTGSNGDFVCNNCGATGTVQIVWTVLQVDQNQHCTNDDCPYTMSHTGQWCGYEQIRRCPCPFDYPEN